MGQHGTEYARSRADQGLDTTPRRRPRYHRPIAPKTTQ
jgi:hypothetical protein